MSTLRQPIISVLGHVDHGKTSILDAIRGTTITSREAGGITQRIAATEINIDRIIELSGGKYKKNMFKIPGLLFVDTPGHVAFSNMRSRGGALADIAILVIDINDGLMPQTIESINILKKFKSPFIIVANKIDLIPFYSKTDEKSFSEFIKGQRNEYVMEFEKRVYEIVNQMYIQGFPSERFDRISDFKKSIPIVPVSAKYNIGIMEILLTVSGLAQRFLTESISTVDGKARASILETRRDESIGTTLDAILYQGTIKTGDPILVNTSTGIQETKVRALFVNRSNRSSKAEERKSVTSASGVRIVISDKLDVIPGTTLLQIDSQNIQEARNELMEETTVKIDLSENGITLKADTLGSLEAVAYELSQKNIGIRTATIGEISRRDIIDVSTLPEQMDRVIAGFNVGISADAKSALQSNDTGVVTSNIIYGLVNDVEHWIKSRKEEMEEDRKQGMPVPSRIRIIPEYIFRAAKPVIVGVKVLSGRIKVGDNLIRTDGKYAGTIKSIREGEISKKFADAGVEVAVAIDGVTLNRQIFPDQDIYVDITEDVVKTLRGNSLDDETMKTLEEIIKIKKKENIFWGTRV
ncbi:MAG: translation initiation factor IF-2 [Cuniculiplasma sp.]